MEDASPRVPERWMGPPGVPPGASLGGNCSALRVHRLTPIGTGLIAGRPCERYPAPTTRRTEGEPSLFPHARMVLLHVGRGSGPWHGRLRTARKRASVEQHAPVVGRFREALLPSRWELSSGRGPSRSGPEEHQRAHRSPARGRRKVRPCGDGGAGCS